MNLLNKKFLLAIVAVLIILPVVNSSSLCIELNKENSYQLHNKIYAMRLIDIGADNVRVYTNALYYLVPKGGSIEADINKDGVADLAITHLSNGKRSACMDLQEIKQSTIENPQPASPAAITVVPVGTNNHDKSVVITDINRERINILFIIIAVLLFAAFLYSVYRELRGKDVRVKFKEATIGWVEVIIKKGGVKTPYIYPAVDEIKTSITLKDRLGAWLIRRRMLRKHSKFAISARRYGKSNFRRKLEKLLNRIRYFFVREDIKLDYDAVNSEVSGIQSISKTRVTDASDKNASDKSQRTVVKKSVADIVRERVYCRAVKGHKRVASKLPDKAQMIQQLKEVFS